MCSDFEMSVRILNEALGDVEIEEFAKICVTHHPVLIKEIL